MSKQQETKLLLDLTTVKITVPPLALYTVERVVNPAHAARTITHMSMRHAHSSKHAEARHMWAWTQAPSAKTAQDSGTASEEQHNDTPGTLGWFVG